MSKPVRWIILVVWQTMLTIFAVRHLPDKNAANVLEVAAAEGLDADQKWYGFYIEQPGNKRAKIGWLASERKQTASGYVTRTSNYMRLAIQGAERVVRTETKVVTDLQHKLQYLDFSMSSDLVKFKVIGTVRGNRLDLDIETAAGRREETLPLTEVPLMPDDLTDLLADEGGLEVGKTYEMPFFEPSTFRYDKAKIRVVDRIEHTAADGTKIVAFRVVTDLAGARAESIVDERGETLEQRLAGFVMVREPHRTAMEQGWSKKPADIPEMAAVNSDRQIPDPRKAKRLKVRLNGVTLDDLPLDDERQTLEEGNVLTVVKKPLPEKGGFKIPYQGDDEKLRELLKPTPLLEVDDPAIRRQAREIVPEGADALAAARAIAKWVNVNLKKKPLISMTSAKEVLMVRQGDCNEHAALFAALARAAGLPAQVHVGLVYHQGAFYYHAWNGVYVGEWISLDATFGQFPADATHLRIVSGGLDRQIDIIRLMGSVNINVLEQE